MSLLRRSAEVPDQAVASAGTNLSTKLVYGAQASMMHATRPPGYHSRPHVHACEQLNFVVAGELWAFMVDERGGQHAFHMQPGDFKRVPAMAVHWSWNRSDEPVTLIEFHAPGLQQDPGMRGGAYGLFAPWEPEVVSGSPQNLFVDPQLYPVKDVEALALEGRGDADGLLRKAADVPNVAVKSSSPAQLSTQLVYGPAGSIMYATRPPGYHSKPHIHDCEQLNLVVHGEVWGFVIDPDGEGHAFEMHEGDFWRVPANSVHWAWNRSEAPSTLVEFHAPGLQGDPRLGDFAVGLFGDGEIPRTSGSPANIFLDPSLYPVAEVEAARPTT